MYITIIILAALIFIVAIIICARNYLINQVLCGVIMLLSFFIILNCANFEKTHSYKEKEMHSNVKPVPSNWVLADDGKLVIFPEDFDIKKIGENKNTIVIEGKIFYNIPKDKK